MRAVRAGLAGLRGRLGVERRAGGRVVDQLRGEARVRKEAGTVADITQVGQIVHLVGERLTAFNALSNALTDHRDEIREIRGVRQDPADQAGQDGVVDTDPASPASTRRLWTSTGP